MAHRCSLRGFWIESSYNLPAMLQSAYLEDTEKYFNAQLGKVGLQLDLEDTSNVDHRPSMDDDAGVRRWRAIPLPTTEAREGSMSVE